MGLPQESEVPNHIQAPWHPSSCSHSALEPSIFQLADQLANSKHSASPYAYLESPSGPTKRSMASADIVLHCCSAAYPCCCPATRLLCCPAAFSLPSAPEPSLSRTPANVQSVPASGVPGDITPVLASGVHANIFVISGLLTPHQTIFNFLELLCFIFVFLYFFYISKNMIPFHLR